jgi:hypothetical protein
MQLLSCRIFFSYILSCFGIIYYTTPVLFYTTAYHPLPHNCSRPVVYQGSTILASLVALYKKFGSQATPSLGR